MADLIGLVDLKTALGVTDTSRDADLTLTASTASNMVLDWLGRDPRATDYIERADGRGRTTLLVNQYPINSVASIAIDGQAFTDTFSFDDNVIFSKSVFPAGRRNVTVSYNAGEDPLPTSVKQATIYTARAILTASGVDLNSTGESWPGVISQQWTPGGPGVVPAAAQTLLQSYKRRSSL